MTAPDRGFRLFLIATVAATLLISAATIALVTTAVVRAGVIHVDITSHREPVSLRLSLPAFPANLILRGVRVEHISAEDREMFDKLARAAVSDLSALPDTTLLEVTDNGQRVRVRSVSRGVAIEVEGPEARVSVRIPRATVQRLARQFGS